MGTVTRSFGLPTGVPGLVAGGGGYGITEALDAAVAHAADLLRDAYGMDVTIRFNSDRRSGGAWLATSKEDGFGLNAEIGITASLFDTADLKSALDEIDPTGEAFRKRMAQDGQDAENPPATYIRMHAHIGTAALKDPGFATDMQDDPKRRYAHVICRTAEEALAVLSENATAPGAAVPRPGR